jgi:hypothetical protein
MYHPTDFDSLRPHVDTERDAFVAAAVLPHLPEGQALARIRPEDERVPQEHTAPDTIDEFRRRVAPIAPADNLRRVEYAAPAGHTAIEHKVELTPRPHSIRSYIVGSYDVDLLCPTDNEYDWSTPQTSLSEFGVAGASVLHKIGFLAPDDTYPRKPNLPV